MLRGKLLLGYSDAELANMGGYHLVHYDDLAYVASAHQECEFQGVSSFTSSVCVSLYLVAWPNADALFPSAPHSAEDWCQRHDSLQVPEQRGHLAVAADLFQACLQKLQAWLCHQHPPTSHVS